MRNFILPLAVLFLSAISFFLMLRDREKNPVRQGEEVDPEKLESMEKPMLIYSAIMVVITMVIAFMLPKWFPGNSFFANMKRVMLMSVIWPIAYIDYVTYRIPNTFILFGLICRAVLLPFEFIFDSMALATLIGEAIAAGGLFIASMLCAICVKGSIGYGDIKLFVVMGLMLGMMATWSAIFTSLLICLVVSVVLLATKKKGRRDVIPFGPEIVIGTFISICLTGM